MALVDARYRDRAAESLKRAEAEMQARKAGKAGPSEPTTVAEAGVLSTRVCFESVIEDGQRYVRAQAFGVEGRWMRSERAAFGSLMERLSRTDYLFKQIAP